MCNKLSIGAYLVGQVKKLRFFTAHFYDGALRFNPNYRCDPECPVAAMTVFFFSLQQKQDYFPGSRFFSR
jgi:hypothetical protein